MKCHSGPKDSPRGFSERRDKAPSHSECILVIPLLFVITNRYSNTEKSVCVGLVVKVLDRDWLVPNSSKVPLETHRVGKDAPVSLKFRYDKHLHLTSHKPRQIFIPIYVQQQHSKPDLLRNNATPKKKQNSGPFQSGWWERVTNGVRVRMGIRSRKLRRSPRRKEIKREDSRERLLIVHSFRMTSPSLVEHCFVHPMRWQIFLRVVLS
ncbi:hypothetical protein TNCV_2562721 [Trichonephila clavipes]|uniref:Uncharacterized protein n=1 Tax=Trichonephila clavipes TaxID=2585209 RepID=A0A8X6USU8_TRICX|nr:hypothetical protein TNCV_2562721 [Trichonephila clavipes]